MRLRTPVEPALPAQPIATLSTSRPQSPAERWVDATVHVAALLLAVAGVFMLASHAASERSGLELSAVVIYGLGLLLMLTFSLLYNMLDEAPPAPLLRRLDHCGIFLMIAGTYTPLLTQLKDPWTAGWLGALVWGGALTGIALKFAGARFANGSVTAYLALSWVAVLAYQPFLEALPGLALVLILAGGALYTAGIAFHLWERLRFQRSIWHGFVTSAAACHFAAITVCLSTVQP